MLPNPFSRENLIMCLKGCLSSVSLSCPGAYVSISAPVVVVCNTDMLSVLHWVVVVPVDFIVT